MYGELYKKIYKIKEIKYCYIWLILIYVIIDWSGFLLIMHLILDISLIIYILCISLIISLNMHLILCISSVTYIVYLLDFFLNIPL